MSPLEFDQKLEQIIHEFTLRIIVPRWTEFDTLWEAAIRVCERYQLGNGTPVAAADESGDSAKGTVTSLESAFAADGPAQTHPPIAA